MRIVLAGMLLVLATPLAAQEAQSDYEAAVAARLAGDNADAVRLLDRWIAAHPQDSDALVQRGYAHLALGNPRAAERDFRAALALAPDYADARNGLALVAERREAPRGGFLIAGGAWSDLDSGARDWGEANLSGEAPVSRALSVGGRASWYRRFGLEDVELEGRIAARPSENVWLRASVGGTPNADFRPELALGAGADVRIAQGPQATVLSLDAAWQRFPLEEIVTVSPGLTQYFGGGRWWGTLRGIGIVPQKGNVEVGVLGRIDHAPDERRRYSLGAVTAPDTSLGVVTRITSLFAGAELPLTKRLSLLPSISHEWREAGPDRTELRLEVKASF
ncbi:YaiO family outer membrane beta-barrel protein [Qipengyuania gaetbuli]|uniref:YaiO family outer membrane beta-barrel protein n=1 Tax=Qipengyuania gaetbuli TaxID=266952 RepID=UPI001C9996BC|nr:YaiO family outer membrane beta-barrel protein [Qipengyuania gaetbuli]MBY6015113.1 YaiO family outer membrane beta-barrel protein [Qipengyuania gaetbuli]